MPKGSEIGWLLEHSLAAVLVVRHQMAKLVSCGEEHSARKARRNKDEAVVPGDEGNPLISLIVEPTNYDPLE